MHVSVGGYNMGSVASYVAGSLYYGSDKNVIKDQRLLFSCKSHVNRVKVCPIRGILATCADGAIYRYKDTECKSVCIGSSVSAVCHSKDGLLFASGVLNGKVHAFSSDFIPLPFNVDVSPLKVTALHVIDTDSHLLLLIGCTDSTLHLLSISRLNPTELDIVDELVLEGHTNWISCIDHHNTTFATTSLDKTIRVWSLQGQHMNQDSLQEIIVKKRHIQLDNKKDSFEVCQSALLIGHEAAVHYCNFIKDDLLLTAAADRSIILWNVEEGVSISQIGDCSGGQLGASVGADHSIGFHWAHFDEEESMILAGQSGGSIQRWINGHPIPPLTGHFGAVESVAWLSNDLLLSASADQTTRVWLIQRGGSKELDIPQQNDATSTKSHDIQLLEISRTQIHGYDINAVTEVENGFASAADEKVIRLFTAPENWTERLDCISNGTAMLNQSSGITVPALGLTNKQSQKGDSIQHAIPVETELARSTLWPESGKLYGHGNEVYRLAYDHDKATLISACKATRPEDAAPRIWHKTGGGQFLALRSLPGPTLTVTCLSIRGRHLLVTSRDRNIYIYRDYTELISSVVQAHTRIIWSAAWLSDYEFVTVSRDKHIKTWKLSADGEVNLVHDITVDVSCTSVVIADELVVIGTENGGLFVYNQEMSLINDLCVCSGEINDLKWRNGLLAVASADHSLHVIPKDHLK